MIWGPFVFAPTIVRIIQGKARNIGRPDARVRGMMRSPKGNSFRVHWRLHIPAIVIYTLGTKKRGGPMEGHKSREELYNEACVLHKSLDEKLWKLQEKPFLTED